MKTKIISKLLTALPLLLFSALLSGLLLIRLLYGMVLPLWGAWGLGIAWCVMAFDYLIRAELFKQIGGFAVTLLAVLILTGALLPKETVAHYPRVTSEEMVRGLESTWNAVYHGNIFQKYSLKQQLIDYGASLGKLDPFRTGKMILYALLGFALGVCYLFPIEPFRPKAGSQRSKVKSQRSAGLISDLRSPISGTRRGSVAYARRFLLLFAAGAVFASQVELLQVLSPTRMVTLGSFVDSSTGLLVGLLAFVPVHVFYLYLAEHRAKGTRRFNILGVGVDAVNMGDCLRLFERIIEHGVESMEHGGLPERNGQQHSHKKHENALKGRSFYNRLRCSLEQTSEEGRDGSCNRKDRIDHKGDVQEENGCGECRSSALARGAKQENRKIKTGSYFSGLMNRMAGFFSFVSIRVHSWLKTVFSKNSDSLGCPSSVAVVEDKSAVQSSEFTVQGLTNNESPITNNSPPRPVMTSALGVAGIIEARRNQKLQRILNESVLNTPDGMPLVWLGKLFGYQNIERVYGPDLLRDVCAYSASRGWKHFFYGAAPGIVEKLQERLEQKHPDIQISGIYCPPFRDLTPEEEAEVVDMVNSSGTDIFWIGISTPKQLYFMDHIRPKLRCKIICPVGYAFDVNAGVQQDAPDWAKYSGFQWLHRAIKQPRLWKRYLPDNPRFVFEVALQILHLRQFPMYVHERSFFPFKDVEGYFRFPAGVVSLSAMTLKGARDRVLNWVASGQRHYVNICTADTMVQCADRPDLAKIVSEAGMATTDGMPLVWLAHHYGFHDATRVYGPDLMLALCEATAALNQKSEDGGQRSETARDQTSEVSGLRLDQNSPDSRHSSSDLCCLTSDLRSLISEKKCSHFFYGATDEVLAQLKTNLLEKFPSLQIAGMYSPPFRPLTDSEKDGVTEMINSSGADIVWCGLGTPKQDYWVAEFRPRLNAAAILAVGAAFNFHAGHVRQAPRWMMKGGLEWLFRLGVEPRRLWRRYIIGNPRFILLTWRQFLSRRSRGD